MTSITSITLNHPNYIPQLKDVATLVSVEISVPSFSITDKQVSDEVNAQKRASKHASKVTKQLMADCPEYKAITNKRSSIMSSWLPLLTYLWAAGLYLLPNSRLAQFKKEVAVHIAEFNALVQAFLNVYEDTIAKQAFVQGDMFKRDDYPTRDEVARKFSINVYMQEVPSGDFRNVIGQEAVQDAVRDLQEQASNYVQAMADRQVEDFRKVIDQLIHACRIETNVGENGEIKVERGRLYQSTFDKALEYCEVLKDMNIMGNPALDALRLDIQKTLGGLTVEQVRDSDSKRITIKEDLEDIKNRFGF